MMKITMKKKIHLIYLKNPQRFYLSCSKIDSLNVSRVDNNRHSNTLF